MIDPNLAVDTGKTDVHEEWKGDSLASAHLSGPPHWRVLIVDADVELHRAVRLALRDLSFKGRALELLSAYGSAQGFDIVREHADIALVLLDVGLETGDAGLILAGRIRNELKNSRVRLVLCSDQPERVLGRAALKYDINDYKSKTELGAQNLFITVIAALRSYENLAMLERTRVGLGNILAGATNLYQIQSLREFASGVLSQISAILDVGADGVLCLMQGSSRVPTVIAATGTYAGLTLAQAMPLDHPLRPSINRAFAEKCSQFQHPDNVLFIQTDSGSELAIAIAPPWPVMQIQRELLELYCQRIGAAFDNLYMFGQLRKAQEATVAALADLVEFRDSNTGGHVRRVQQLSTALAWRMKQRGAYPQLLTPQLLDMIGLASLLHDVGKVATPDCILLKPGQHTHEERQRMRQHAGVGQKILERAAEMVDGISYLTYGAQIAGGHHEHFDGAGYPLGLIGSAIPLAARIVAVVDVFDALQHGRPYKEAWPQAAVRSYIVERSGAQFDPEVVAALVDLIERDPALGLECVYSAQ